MRVLQINLGNFSSTGGIARGISKVAQAQGIETYFAYPIDPNNKPVVANDIIIGNRLGRRVSIKLGRITGFNGCFSFLATARFLMKVKQLKPDIIHMHNLHNCYINIPMLFGYLKKHHVCVVWTLHDCWAFTGQCPYFTLVDCDQWKRGCSRCTQYKQYPASNVDRTSVMWKLKKKWFTSLERMTIVTPSEWLADLARESFLKEYPIRVINNGIDLSVFKSIESCIREQLGIGCRGIKYMVLGVAFDWERRKGLDVFIELSKRLDREYQLVLVGTNEEVDQALPCNIISIHKTQDRTKLAELYTAADLFFNPTREENFPTVNIEALACGTPVATFRTGGSPEIIDASCGVVIDECGFDAIAKIIAETVKNAAYHSANCEKRAAAFNSQDKFAEYVSLYNEILKG